ncbi:hypothetical protein MA16_Dca026662 [Dendrobium catenatum]|uniref:Uncharacterized protein n=1 Tax=Dendrobium catenatum TaxID=906689 RepID=A0A2I0VM05_9ASPA|nr:hypothetical protein MA16_Dca026662 [Dendrobium catenatum]
MQRGVTGLRLLVCLPLMVTLSVTWLMAHRKVLFLVVEESFMTTPRRFLVGVPYLSKMWIWLVLLDSWTVLALERESR